MTVLNLLLSWKSQFSKWDIPITAPTAPGTYAYVVTVADDGNQSESVSINITIENLPPSIAIDGPTAIDADAGSANIVKLNATIGSSQLRTIEVWEDGEVQVFLSLKLLLNELKILIFLFFSGE